MGSLGEKKRSTSTSTTRRRCSPRLREIKRPYYGPTRSSRSIPIDDFDFHDFDDATLTTLHPPNNNNSTSDLGVFSYVPHTRYQIARVKKTLTIYNNYYLQFFHQEEMRPDLKAISKETILIALLSFISLYS